MSGLTYVVLLLVVITVLHQRLLSAHRTVFTLLVPYGPIELSLEYSDLRSSAETQCAWDLYAKTSSTLYLQLPEGFDPAYLHITQVFDDLGSVFNESRAISSQNRLLKYSDTKDLQISLPRTSIADPIFRRLGYSKLFTLSGIALTQARPKILTLDHKPCWIQQVPQASIVTPLSRSRILSCLRGRTITFAGDSIIREIYAEMISILLNTTNKILVWPFKDKHANLAVFTQEINATFYWTPTAKVLYDRIANLPRDDFLIAGVGAWHVWRESVGEYHDFLQRIIQLRHPGWWVGIPYPVSLPGLRVPIRVRAWNALTETLLQDSSMRYIDYYALTRAKASESDGNIHYGYWARGGPGNCTLAALSQALQEYCS